MTTSWKARSPTAWTNSAPSSLSERGRGGKRTWTRHENHDVGEDFTGADDMGLLGDIGKIMIGGCSRRPRRCHFGIHGSAWERWLRALSMWHEKIVEIGTDVYKAAPPAVFALGGQPIPRAA